MGAPAPAAIATCVAALVLAAPAYAQWTVGAFAGACTTRDTSLSVAQPADGTDVTFSPVTYESDSFASPIYYGYRVGYRPPHRRFGVEAELIHMKVFADTTTPVGTTGRIRGEPGPPFVPVGTVLERFSISHGVNLVLVNALLRGESRRTAAGVPAWVAIGRLGAGASVPHPESTAPGGVTLERYEWGAFAVQAAGAIELRVWRRLYLSAEYKVTRTAQDVAVVGGTARTTLLTQHLAVGVTALLP